MKSECLIPGAKTGTSSPGIEGVRQGRPVLSVEEWLFIRCDCGPIFRLARYFIGLPDEKNKMGLYAVPLLLAAGFSSDRLDWRPNPIEPLMK